MDGEMFHIVKLVVSIEPKSRYSQKILSMLLWLGYEPGRGLGAKLQDMTKLISHHVKNDIVDLRYEGEVPIGIHTLDFELQRPLPSVYQIFQSAGFLKSCLDKEEDLLQSLRNLFIVEDSPPRARKEFVEEAAKVFNTMSVILDSGYKAGKGLGARL